MYGVGVSRRNPIARSAPYLNSQLSTLHSLQKNRRRKNPAAVLIDLTYRQAAALTSFLLTIERITNSVQIVMAAPMTRQIHAFWTKPAMM